MTNEEAISYLENAVCELDAGIKIYSGTIKEEFIEQRKCFTVALSALREQAEIVECKNCIYQKDAKVNCKGFIICPASNMEITDDDYCSYGERRESEASK